jgi:prevent-host-death family protein
MKESIVSIAEGKKGFSRIIKDAAQKNRDIIVTRRGRPVAVIVPYEEYRRSRRLGGFQKIMEARKAFLQARVQADEVYEESKRQLEKKP